MIEPTWQTDDGRVKLWLGDCLDVLPTLAEGSVDAVVTDPPYGIDYNPTRSQASAATGTRKSHERVAGDKEAFDPSPFLAMASKCIFWGANNFCRRLPDSHGWLIWDKRDGGSVFRGFVASDAELAWTNVTGRVQTFSHRWCGHLRDSERDVYVHPTQKPIALMEWCLSLVPKAETIFDPFMGSGTTGIAAMRTGRRFLGCETDPKHYETAKARIIAELERMPLFEEKPTYKQAELVG